MKIYSQDLSKIAQSGSTGHNDSTDHFVTIELAFKFWNETAKT